MVEAVFARLGEERPAPRFTVGITDDVSRLSLPVARDGFQEPEDVFRAVF